MCRKFSEQIFLRMAPDIYINLVIALVVGLVGTRHIHLIVVLMVGLWLKFQTEIYD